MYDVIVDVDGVLLDVHTGLKHLFSQTPYEYDVNNVYSYDFNRSLPNKPEYRRLPPRSLIYKMFGNPTLFKISPYDWESITCIRNYAACGVKFLIYTLSYNMSVRLVKQALFTRWFCNDKNISFLDITPTDTEDFGFKKGAYGRTVVEDCHINLRNYDEYTYKYLVNRPYNREQYNPDYSDVFNDPTVIRCENTHQALEFAVSKAMSMKRAESIA